MLAWLIKYCKHSELPSFVYQIYHCFKTISYYDCLSADGVFIGSRWRSGPQLATLCSPTPVMMRANDLHSTMPMTDAAPGELDTLTNPLNAQQSVAPSQLEAIGVDGQADLQAIQVTFPALHLLCW